MKYKFSGRKAFQNSIILLSEWQNISQLQIVYHNYNIPSWYWWEVIWIWPLDWLFLFSFCQWSHCTGGETGGWQRGQSPPPLKIFSLCEVTKSLCCKGVQSPLAGETETRWQECHRTLLQTTNHVKLVIVFLFSFSYQRNIARQQKTAALHDAACCMSSTTYIHHPAAWN